MSRSPTTTLVYSPQAEGVAPSLPHSPFLNWVLQSGVPTATPSPCRCRKSLAPKMRPALGDSIGLGLAGPLRGTQLWGGSHSWV